MIKISVGSWAFASGSYANDPVSLERLAARLAEADYDGIELSGFPPHATLERYPNAAGRAGLVKMLADYGLGVSGYAADFTRVSPAAASNKLAYIDLFARCVEFCAETGSPSIRVDSGVAPASLAEWEYRKVEGQLAEVWTQAAEIASRSKVRVVWEFESGLAFNRVSEIVALHKRVNHANFQILFDTAHAYMCGVEGVRRHGTRETLAGGLPEFVKKLSGRIGAIHVMDSEGALNQTGACTHRPFGEGCIDFRTLAPQLLDVTGVGWWCVDFCSWPGAWNLLESSHDFVLELLNSKTAA